MYQNSILNACMQKVKNNPLGLSILKEASYKGVVTDEELKKAKEESYAVEKIYIGRSGGVQGGHCGFIVAVNGDKNPKNVRGEIYINENFVKEVEEKLGKEQGAIYLSNVVVHEFLHGNQRKHIKNLVQNSKSQKNVEGGAKPEGTSAQIFESIKRDEYGYVKMILTEAASMCAGLTVCMQLAKGNADIIDYALSDTKKIGNISTEIADKLKQELSKSFNKGTEQQSWSRNLFKLLVDGQVDFLSQKC